MRSRGNLPKSFEENRLPLSATTPIHRPRHGFTLLELLVVIVIIGLLAAYVGPRYFAQLDKAELAVARTQIEIFVRALDGFRLDVGRYPNTAEGLQALRTRPDTAERWNGPYINKDIPPDPWGKMYIYKSDDKKTYYEIKSYGKDGKGGGTGKDADISSDLPPS
jgi:general secretion pathway protein G